MVGSFLITRKVSPTVEVALEAMEVRALLIRIARFSGIGVSLYSFVFYPHLLKLPGRLYHV